MELLNAENADEAYNKFLKKFSDLLDIHAPMKEMSKKEKKIQEKPWLTQGLLKSINKKRKLFLKFKNEKLKNKNGTTYQQYKMYNDNINKLKKLRKRNYYQDYFTENHRNSKKVWKGINTLLNRHRNQPNNIHLEENGLISNPTIVADKFNEFYLNVADNLSSKIKQKGSKFQDYLKNPSKSSFALKEILPVDVVKVINDLDGTKSGDIHNISPDLIKISKQTIVQPLSIIFNRCIHDGIFPQSMKSAKVIPVHKGNSKLITSNYRPISLLPIFSKIFERLIYDQFMNYIDKHNILSDLQFGFQKNKSTEHAISSILSNINKASHNNQSSYCIFLDFAKAFDTVNHDILIEKLNYYGMDKQTLALFTSYLANRKQLVDINGTPSKTGTIKHGVPQGSILGPLLFLLYINDIAQSSEILKNFLFADDTTVFYSDDPSNPKTEDTLNTELDKVSCWLAANKLSLNVKKSNFLHFHHGKSKKQSTLIKINNISVEEKQFTKYLGVFIDNKLSWKTHIQYIAKKLAKSIGLITKVRGYVNESCLLKLYHSFIQSHIDYNILNWSSVRPTNLNPIEMKVKKAIRTISFSKSKYDHTTPLFRRHNILPLTEQIEYKKASFMWKISNNLVCSPVDEIFPRNPNSPQRIILPHPKTEFDKLQLNYSCVKTWNSVPRHLKSKSHLKSFNSELKKNLLRNLDK